MPRIPGFDTYSAPSTFGGWTVDRNSIDLIGPYWNAADGSQSVDLDGLAPGSISQTFTTVAGQQYRLTFAYSANKDRTSGTPEMVVEVNGAAIGTPFTHALTHGLNPIPWSDGSLVFTAPGTSTKLTFASGDPSGAMGIALDAVSVVPDLSAPAAATDFAFGPATPTALLVDPGSTGQTSVPTSASGSGTIAVTASIAPAGQGVAVALGSPTVATGSSATLTVSATAGAVPGSYTATITGTLGSSTHSTTIPVTVLPATGIPGLLQAVPGIEATDGLSGSMTDNPGLANGLWIAGMLNGTSGTPFSLTLLTASSCPGGILPADATTVDTLGAALSGTIGTDGTAYFGGLLHITPGSLSSFIAARVGSGPVGRCIVVSPPNDQWVTALDISGKTGTGDATNGYIDQPGVARWYKFTVSPGTHLHIALSNLPADYDVFLFKDISQAYTDLTASNVTASGGASSLLNLNKLSAEFASADVANAFTSNAFTSNAFTSNAFTSNAFTSNAFTSNAFTSNAFTSNAFTSNAFTSNAFTSNAFTSNAFTSNAFTSNAFTSNAFTSNAFTSNAFTSNAFTSSSTFNPYGVDLSAYSSAQVRSVIAGSANLGLAPETIDGNTWTNSGTYYIRVNGQGSASSLAGAFSLSVTKSGNLCNPVVAAQQSNAVLVPDSFTAPTGQNAATLVLWDRADPRICRPCRDPLVHAADVRIAEPDPGRRGRPEYVQRERPDQRAQRARGREHRVRLRQEPGRVRDQGRRHRISQGQSGSQIHRPRGR